MYRKVGASIGLEQKQNEPRAPSRPMSLCSPIPGRPGAGADTDRSPALLLSQHTPECSSHFLEPLPGTSKTAAGLLECELRAGAQLQQIAHWPSACDETEGGQSAVSSERATCCSQRHLSGADAQPCPWRWLSQGE